MTQRHYRRRRKGFLVLLVAIFGASGWLFLDHALADEEVFGTSSEKIVTIVDDGSYSIPLSSQAQTVEEMLEIVGIHIEEEDRVFPHPDTELESGMRVHIDRAKTLTLFVGGEKREIITHTNTAAELIQEQGIVLGEEDFVLPGRDVLLESGGDVEVVRVEVVEEQEIESIPYQTIETEDDDLGWQEQKIITKGEKGEKTLIYSVVYHDEEKVKSTLIHTEITKEPVTEEVVQGTYVKLGKKHTGLGTWYAHTGTMAAASPWLPMGSFAKVTNEANGKSVIVKINDRGPFGENRIIDLDKVAFQEIASLGAGVIEVKVEEIEN